MKIIMQGGVLNIPLPVEQIICRHNQISQREKAWNKKGYEVLEIRVIDRYTTLMRFVKVE